ncbi:MAG: hypothetical protein AAF216_12005 [Pseudomonadota bacterium]
MILWFGKKKKKQELEEAGKAIEAAQVTPELEQENPPPLAREVARESGSEGADIASTQADTSPLRPSGTSPASGGGEAYGLSLRDVYFSRKKIVK